MTRAAASGSTIDPGSLAEAIERVSRMPLRAMGERGRAWVAREFTWDRVAEETIALYRRLTPRERPEER